MPATTCDRRTDRLPLAPHVQGGGVGRAAGGFSPHGGGRRDGTTRHSHDDQEEEFVFVVVLGFG